uniref:Uncharacterized protein n=1 Tax=Glossina brevipalpis TaxID=37001 RepID=A0A1A9WMB3_9MUSC
MATAAAAAAAGAGGGNAVALAIGCFFLAAAAAAGGDAVALAIGCFFLVNISSSASTIRFFPLCISSGVPIKCLSLTCNCKGASCFVLVAAATIPGVRAETAGDGNDDGDDGDDIKDNVFTSRFDCFCLAKFNSSIGNNSLLRAQAICPESGVISI